MNAIVTDPVLLQRINVPKAGDVLANQLRARIRAGELREGQALPTERELGALTGLSRASVREALRILEVEGLVETRPGRNGGSRVRRPAGDELGRHLELFIWGRNIGFEDLHDVREALEALAAEGAARRRTEADLVELAIRTEAVEKAVKDVERYLAANLAWHMAVVRASHNELLTSIMHVLSNAIHQATASEAFDSPEVRASTLAIHRAVLSAIQAGDADAARRRMARHVAAARAVAVSWSERETPHLRPVLRKAGSKRAGVTDAPAALAASDGRTEADGRSASGRAGTARKRSVQKEKR